MTDQDRAEFEAWFDSKRQLIGESGLKKFPAVVKAMTDIAEGAWLAARRTQSQQVRELVEAHRKLAKLVLCNLSDTPVAEGAEAEVYQLADEQLDHIETALVQLKETQDAPND